MYRFFICLLLTGLSGFFVKAQPAHAIQGDWVGIIKEGKLPILFHISGDGQSGYKCTLDNLRLRQMGIPCKTMIVKDDSLELQLNGIPAAYSGLYRSGIDSVYGYWVQGGKSIPLDLKRIRRPQTPQPPFPYQSDSVEYDNADKTVHLGATLTLPEVRKRGRRYPAVILITGSGQQDRDETLFGHKPFAVIADYLTRKGIAVLRIDDRGMGKSKGDLIKATTADFAGDVMASLTYLKQRPDIDTGRIGLIGHSEGGAIAPMVYCRWPHLAFLVLLAGPGVPGSEVILRQQTDPVREISNAAYDAYYSLVRDKVRILNETYGQPDSVTMKLIKASYTQWKPRVPDSLLTILHAKNVSAELYAMQVSMEMRPWFRYFYKTDPADFLRQVKCPVLALNGEKDTQVDPRQNLPAIKNALNAGGNSQVTTRIIPGLNHLFQHCQTGDFSEYPAIEETFAPEATEIMADWIRKTISGKN